VGFLTFCAVAIKYQTYFYSATLRCGYKVSIQRSKMFLKVCIPFITRIITFVFKTFRCLFEQVAGMIQSKVHAFLLFRVRKMCYTKAYIELLVETDEDSFCGTLIR
jgi:hypothetical protein